MKYYSPPIGDWLGNIREKSLAWEHPIWRITLLWPLRFPDKDHSFPCMGSEFLVFLNSPKFPVLSVGRAVGQGRAVGLSPGGG